MKKNPEMRNGFQKSGGNGRNGLASITAVSPFSIPGGQDSLCEGIRTQVQSWRGCRPASPDGRTELPHRTDFFRLDLVSDTNFAGLAERIDGLAQIF
jgi:hypothetical protein